MFLYHCTLKYIYYWCILCFVFSLDVMAVLLCTEVCLLLMFDKSACWCVSLVDCCVHRVVWCFTTQGMANVGQDELVVVLETLPDENTVPRDIFCYFSTIYEEAGKGKQLILLTCAQSTIAGTSTWRAPWKHCDGRSCLMKMHCKLSHCYTCL